MREIRCRLHELPEKEVTSLVQRQGEHDRERDSQDEPRAAEKKRVGDQLGKVYIPLTNVSKNLSPAHGLPSSPKSGLKSLNAIWAL